MMMRFIFVIFFVVILKSAAMSQNIEKIDSALLRFNYYAQPQLDDNCFGAPNKIYFDELKLERSQITVLQQYLLSKMKEYSRAVKGNYDKNKGKQSLHLFGPVSYDLIVDVNHDVVRLSPLNSRFIRNYSFVCIEDIRLFLDDVIRQDAFRNNKSEFKITPTESGVIKIRLYDGKQKMIKNVHFTGGRCFLQKKHGRQKQVDDANAKRCCELVDNLFLNPTELFRLYHIDVPKTDSYFDVVYEVDGSEYALSPMHYIDEPKILYNPRFYELIDIILKLSVK